MKKYGLSIWFLAMSLLPTSASQPEALLVHLQNGAKQSFLLDNIQKISFLNGKLLLKSSEDAPIFAVGHISKINFGNRIVSGTTALASFTIQSNTAIITTPGNVTGDDIALLSSPGNGLIKVSNIQITESSTCLETYFTLNEGFENYEIWLDETQLGQESDTENRAFTCFNYGTDLTRTWTVTVLVPTIAPVPAQRQRVIAETVAETYDLVIKGDVFVFTGLDKMSKEIKTTEYFSIIGIRLAEEPASGIFLKRKIYSDGSFGKIEKWIK